MRKELSHDCCQRDHGLLLTNGDQSFVERLECFIVLDGNQGGHVQGASQIGTTSTNLSLALVSSTLAGVDAQYWMLGAGALGRPRGMVWGGRREEGSGWGAYVYLWQIRFDVWQN